MRKKRKQKKQVKEKADKIFQRKKLYTALLCLYKFRQWNDFLFLKSDEFLNLCESQSIGWNLTGKADKSQLLPVSQEQIWPFHFSCTLTCKENNYGEINFFSFQKFSPSKKSFLKKIASFISETIHFIENKDTMETIKKQWSIAFDSFSQAFCITDKNLKILRANKSFQKLTKTTKLSVENFFSALAIPVKKLEKEEVWLAKGVKEGQKIHWEISFTPLFLKKEQTQIFLFLIKDVTEEIKMEKKISSQAQERELGFIKASIAHELNNPTAGIKALLSLMETRLPSTQTLAKDSLKDMKKAVDVCCQIIHQLLSASQESETQRPEPPILL